MYAGKSITIEHFMGHDVHIQACRGNDHFLMKTNTIPHA